MNSIKKFFLELKEKVNECVKINKQLKELKKSEGDKGRIKEIKKLEERQRKLSKLIFKKFIVIVIIVLPIIIGNVTSEKEKPEKLKNQRKEKLKNQIKKKLKNQIKEIEKPENAEIIKYLPEDKKNIINTFPEIKRKLERNDMSEGEIKDNINKCEEIINKIEHIDSDLIRMLAAISYKVDCIFLKEKLEGRILEKDRNEAIKLIIEYEKIRQILLHKGWTIRDINKQKDPIRKKIARQKGFS